MAGRGSETVAILELNYMHAYILCLELRWHHSTDDYHHPRQTKSRWEQPEEPEEYPRPLLDDLVNTPRHIKPSRRDFGSRMSRTVVNA